MCGWCLLKFRFICMLSWHGLIFSFFRVIKTWNESKHQNTRKDSIQGVQNVPTATLQIMDPFKSSLEKDTIMLAGGRRNFQSKREMQKTLHSSEQYHRWMWKARYSSLYLPRAWQSLWQTTTMLTHLYRRGDFRLYLGHEWNSSPTSPDAWSLGKVK